MFFALEKNIKMCGFTYINQSVVALKSSFYRLLQISPPLHPFFTILIKRKRVPLHDYNFSLFICSFQFKYLVKLKIVCFNIRQNGPN